MKYFFIVAASCLFACSPSMQAKSKASAMPQNISLNGKLFSALFHQRSAEYRALCLQGYNIARMRIDGFVAASSKPKAIITDIDETILDNSPYAVHQAYTGKEYESKSWFEWTGRAAADTMAGAASFLKYAAAKKITVIYITNREEGERTATLKNLQRFNLPNADDNHLMTRGPVSSKEARRQQVMQQYEVILLMGDNLADFSAIFDKKTEDERTANTDMATGDFGNKFIVFPNANYGDWESSLYKYNYKLTQPQKDSVIKTVLKNY